MTIQEIKDLIFEIYAGYLNAHPRLLFEEDEKRTVFQEADNSVLPDSTEQILAKYPQLRHCLERLQTEDFMEFVAGIDWISPKPTVFRINLKNGTNFNLKWMGKDFEATISGKKYYLGQLIDYQKALGRLSDLYQEGPMGKEDEGDQQTPADVSNDFGGGGSGGNFPGSEPSAAAGEEVAPEIAQGGSNALEEPEETPEETPGEAQGEAGQESKDLENEPIDFESDASI